MSLVPWERFFENNVEGYLLCDLREMNKIKVDGPGNCGYPMLMSMLSGMELLGGLISEDKKWNSNDGKRYFENFYQKYLKPFNANYTLDDIETEMYSLIRNKLAHTFLTAIKFEVAKNSEKSPIARRDNFIRIDVGLMLKDFEKALFRLKQDLMKDSDVALKFQLHLDQIIQRYGLTTQKAISSHSDTLTVITASGVSSIVMHTGLTSLATTAIPMKNFSDLPLITTDQSTEQKETE